MSVEDRAFGVMESEDEDDPLPVRSIHDTLAAFMLPLTATAAVIAVVCYSLLKGIEYQELFNGNARLRRGLLLLNGTAILLTVLLVARCVHNDAVAITLQQPRRCAAAK